MNGARIGSDTVLPDNSGRAFFRALAMQLRVLYALTLREVRTQSGSSRLGYLWVLSEPLVHIVVLSFLYIAMLRIPLAGTSIVLFFFSGVMPFFFFAKTANWVGGSISANRALLHLALVKNVDVVVARAVVQLASLAVVLILMMTGLYALEHFANTRLDAFILARAIVLMWLLGLGIGMINAVLASIVKNWSLVYSILTRPLYLLSGVFFMAERLPPNFAKVLWYNPILHGVEYFRAGLYPGYGHGFTSVGYLATCAIGTVTFGFALERVLRRKISTKVGVG